VTFESNNNLVSTHFLITPKNKRRKLGQVLFMSWLHKIEKWLQKCVCGRVCVCVWVCLRVSRSQKKYLHECNNNNHKAQHNRMEQWYLITIKA